MAVSLAPGCPWAGGAQRSRQVSEQSAQGAARVQGRGASQAEEGRPALTEGGHPKSYAAPKERNSDTGYIVDEPGRCSAE